MTSTGFPDSAEGGARALIDPRIRDRRVAVLREQGRRRLRVLLALLGVACVAGIAWLVVQSPLLAVDSIAVRGALHEPVTEITAVAGVHHGDALLFVDTATVAHRVEALPWVATARVERHLPHGITIAVTERVPVAWVRRAAPAAGAAESYALVDRTGRVLADQSTPPAGLAELTGLPRAPAVGRRIASPHLAAAMTALPAGLRTQVGQLVVAGETASLLLRSPPGGAAPAAGEVRLGELADVGTKGAAALAVLDDLAQRGQRARYVDVRVPEAPATG